MESIQEIASSRLYMIKQKSLGHKTRYKKKVSNIDIYYFQCLGECVVKKVGFMNDDLSFNKDIIVKFVSRFIKPEHSEDIYTKCTQDVAPVLCATAYEVYQCIYENAVDKWGTRRRG